MLLIAAIFLLAIPFLAAANSAAVQSVFDPLVTQIQNMLSPADDAFAPNETPTVVSGGISSLSSSGIRPEPTTFAAGQYHSLAIKTDGTLWAWGANQFGITGLGTATGRTLVPRQVGTDNNWYSVSVAAEHSLGIRTDGTLWAWGINDGGRTGLGIISGNQLVPRQIGSATDWVSVFAGTSHGLAIKNDGTLWSWGNNSIGATGLGTTTGVQSTPAQVGTATDWTAASAGGHHSLAVRADGTLWAWGDRANGRTGLSAITGAQTTPAQVGTATDWAQVSAGWEHSLALK
ncbi:MAG: hypothetical protein FWF11_03560, partial [Coriobacteriia bacterium]|nr:hypothetical protein [Coriobacteriia bacterium]